MQVTKPFEKIIRHRTDLSDDILRELLELEVIV